VEHVVYNEWNTGRCSKNRNEGMHKGKLRAIVKGLENKIDVDKVKLEKYMLHKHYTELCTHTLCIAQRWSLNYGVLVSLPIGGGGGAEVKITWAVRLPIHMFWS
jgi:ribosomal protein S9